MEGAFELPQKHAKARILILKVTDGTKHPKHKLYWILLGEVQNITEYLIICVRSVFIHSIYVSKIGDVFHTFVRK